jgi:Lambda phage tail tube protein, TTP
MGSKNKAFSSKLEYGDGETYQTSTLYTPFVDLVSIKPPSLKSSEVSTTTLDTPDEMEDAEPSLGDNENATFKIRWLRAQTATVMSMFRKKCGWRVVYPDAPYPSGSKLRFSGWVSEIQNEELVKDGLVEATCTIRVVGKPDLQLIL